MIANRKSSPGQLRRIQFTLLSVFCLTAIFTTGCFDFGTDFTYGKSTDKSVNGVSVFANLLRERGHSVTRKRRLTKRVEKFDTIFWAPDNMAHPPENVVAWLEQWMVGSNPRVLIYVGRFYDGKLPYYRTKFQNSDADNRDKWQREYAEIIATEREYNYDWHLNTSDAPVPYWYESEEDLRLDESKLGGPWATGIDPGAVSLDTSKLLIPSKDYNDESTFPTLSVDSEGDSNVYYYDQYGEWQDVFRDSELETTELLTVDGKPFAFEISSKAAAGRKVIVISNGSFLLNFPLLQPEHQTLATRVADEVVGDVVVLESDYQWPRVGGNANDPALQWSWISRAPMNYIVPHFLFWGVLYCFAFYPNFGRPKRIQFHPPKAFRSHVEAVASILGRSKEKSWAREIIDMWLKRNNKTKN